MTNGNHVALGYRKAFKSPNDVAFRLFLNNKCGWCAVYANGKVCGKFWDNNCVYLVELLVKVLFASATLVVGNVTITEKVWSKFVVHISIFVWYNWDCQGCNLAKVCIKVLLATIAMVVLDDTFFGAGRLFALVPFCISVTKRWDFLVGGVVASGAIFVSLVSSLKTCRLFTLMLNYIVSKRWDCIKLLLFAKWASAELLSGLLAGGLNCRFPLTKGVVALLVGAFLHQNKVGKTACFKGKFSVRNGWGKCFHLIVFLDVQNFASGDGLVGQRNGYLNFAIRLHLYAIVCDVHVKDVHIGIFVVVHVGNGIQNLFALAGGGFNLCCYQNGIFVEHSAFHGNAVVVL